VPIDIVKKVVNDLIAYGEVQKAFGGFEVSDINNQIAERFKLSDLNGVLINYIQKEGEAEKAGLQKDDIIIKINDQWINSKSEFDEQMSYFNPGDKIKLMYRSQGINKEAYLTLTNSEGTKDIIKKQLVSSGSLASDLENVPKVEKDRRNLKSGVRIVRIKGGIFAQLGFREGYIITAINRYPVNSPEEVIEILERIKGRVAIEFINLQNSKSQIIFNIN
jgi:S1-C subfamily serine protease